MRWLCRCFCGWLVLAPRRASPNVVLERVVSEMTLCVTFGGSSSDSGLGRFRFRLKYITFSITFGPLCPTAQELIWFRAHWSRPPSAPRRRQLARVTPSGRLPAKPGRRRDAQATRNFTKDYQNNDCFYFVGMSSALGAAWRRQNTPSLPNIAGDKNKT